jgi:hypothetical protein
MIPQEIDLGASPFTDTYTVMGAGVLREEFSPQLPWTEDTPIGLQIAVIVTAAVFLRLFLNMIRADLARWREEAAKEPPHPPSQP